MFKLNVCFKSVMSVNDGKLSTCRSLPVAAREVSRAEVSGRGDMSEGGGGECCVRD